VDFAESAEHRAFPGRSGGDSQGWDLMAHWGLARLTRIGPVSREMTLNLVAQHSLGLPRSY